MGFFNVFFGGSATSGGVDAEELRIKEILSQSPQIKDVKVVKTPNQAASIFQIRYLSDGLKIVGFAGFPKGFKLDKKYTLIVYNHGGSGDDGKIVPNRFAMYMNEYFKHGYTVWASQYRGIGGSEGKDEYGGRDVHDVLNLLGIAQSFSCVDEYNSFMIGASRGGMMTLLASKHGARMNAAATLGGVTDLARSHRDHPRQIDIHKQLIPGFWWNKEKAYSERSAIYWPEKIHVPLLILHGGADEVVHVGQSVDLAKKLRQLGKAHHLKIYPGAGHNLRNYTQDHKIEILKWFKMFSLRGSANLYPYTDPSIGDRRAYDHSVGLKTKYNDPSLQGAMPYDVSTGIKIPYDHTTGQKQGYDVITGKPPKPFDYVTGLKKPYDEATGIKKGYDPVTGHNEPRPTRRQRLYGIWPWK